MIFRSSMRGLRVATVLVLGVGALLVGHGCSQQATSEPQRPQAASRPSVAERGETVPQPAVGQPTVPQPTVAQPIVAQPTVVQPTVPQPTVAPTAAPQPAVAAPTVVFLGDSLTAGLGVAEGLAFPALLAQRLEREGRPVRVINAGVSGDTTAGGLSRLDWLLRQKPQVIVVELGANDGLRALPLEEVRSNLKEIVTRARSAGAKVLLVGMMIPTNYGSAYSDGFARIYPALAKELHVPLVPFLLEGVAGRPELNLDDGIHPTAEGHERIATTVLPYLQRVLDEPPRR